MALFKYFVDKAKSRTKTYKEKKMGITPIIMIKIIITRQKIESSVYIRSLFETFNKIIIKGIIISQTGIIIISDSLIDMMIAAMFFNVVARI